VEMQNEIHGNLQKTQAKCYDFYFVIYLRGSCGIALTLYRLVLIELIC